MKKAGKIILASLFLLVLLSTFVSAQWYGDLQGAAEQIIDWIEQIFGPFFAVLLGGTGELLFERILLFFVLLAFIFIVLSKIEIFAEHFGARWIVTLVVSLLAVRYSGDLTIVKNILLPYNVLGVALSAFIPLLIFFYFVHAFDSGVMRKIAWILFLTIFFGLWQSRYNDLGDLSWIYFATGIISLIFLLADGTIRRKLIEQKWKQLGYQNREEFASKVRDQLYELEERRKRDTITDSFYKYSKIRLQKQLKAIMKN